MKRSYDKFVARLEASDLRREVEARSLFMHVSLKDVYEGPHSPSVIAARRAVYAWLMKKGKGVNEIAALFDRAPNGIVKMTSKKRKRAA